MNTTFSALDPVDQANSAGWGMIDTMALRNNRLVSVQINDRCPLRCKHCCIGYSSEFKGSGWRIKEEDLIDIILSVDPKVYRGVSFAGGEPTLEPGLLRTGVTACRVRGLMSSIVTAPVWAQNPESADKFLTAIGGIGQVVLSYDYYHLEFLKVSHYENAVRAAVKHNVRACVNICYTEEAEKEQLIDTLSALKGMVTVGSTQTVPVGNAAKNGIGHISEGVTVQKVEDLEKISRGCVLGHTLIGQNDRAVHGCCWSNTVPDAPFSVSLGTGKWAEALDGLEKRTVFQAVRKKGFLNSLSPQGQAEVVRRMSGRSFANECDICIACMREPDATFWNESSRAVVGI